MWDSREEEHQTDLPQFYDWFLRYQAQHSKMLLPLRESIGIGRTQYTTNDNECLKWSIIKLMN